MFCHLCVKKFKNGFYQFPFGLFPFIFNFCHLVLLLTGPGQNGPNPTETVYEAQQTDRN